MERIVNKRGRAPRAMEAYQRQSLAAAGAGEPAEEEARHLPTDPAELLAALEAERERVLSEAKEYAEQQAREAYAEGYARGTEAAQEAFLESVARSADALQAAAGALLEARESFLADLEPQVLELVRVLVARTLGRELREDGEHLQRAVRRALEMLAGEERVIVRLHPEDFAALRQHKVALLEEFDGFQRLEVVPDESIEPGGCLAESQRLSIDARLTTLLRNALASLDD